VSTAAELRTSAESKFQQASNLITDPGGQDTDDQAAFDQLMAEAEADEQAAEAAETWLADAQRQIDAAQAKWAFSVS
jgi:hypothetical protein